MRATWAFGRAKARVERASDEGEWLIHVTDAGSTASIGTLSSTCAANGLPPGRCKSLLAAFDYSAIDPPPSSRT